MSEESKYVPLPKLAEGSKITLKQYMAWRARLVSLAQIKGWANALTADENLPATYIDWQVAAGDTPAETLLIKAALKSNASAMAYMNHMLENERARSCIEVACTDAYPDGLAHLLVTGLDQKFMPKGGYKMSGLREQMRKLKFKSKDDPNDFFEKLAGIKNLAKKLKEKDTISKDELVSQVIAKTPERYMANVKKVIDDKGDAITIDDLETEILDMYELSNIGSGADSDESGEETETAMTNFPGKCYNCGEEGHRANVCPKKKKDRGPGSGGGRGGGGGHQRAGFSGKCRGCGQVGHKNDECWELEKNAAKRPKNWKSKLGSEAGMGAAAADTADDVEYMLCSVDRAKFSESERHKLSDPNIVIADTGASVNVSGSAKGLVNKRTAREGVTVMMGNGQAHSPDAVGDVKVTQFGRDGTQGKNLLWKDVHISKHFEYNLLSVTKYMKEGWNLTGTETEMTLTKGETVLKFDILIKTGQGNLYCAYFKRNVAENASVAAEEESEKVVKPVVKEKTITIKKAHCQLGHMGEVKTRAAAQGLKYRILRGVLKACEACAIAKAKQKSVPKISNSPKSTVPNGRIYADISVIRPPEKSDVKVTRANWFLMVDELTGMKFTSFHSAKNGIVQPTCEKWNLWKQQGVPVAHVRCDNAGENLKLEAAANGNRWKLNIAFEYTGAATPQRNNLVELGFATLWARARAMMIQAGVPLQTRYLVCKECIATVTLLDGLVQIKINGKTMTRYEHWFGKVPRFAKKLKIWGEAGVVKTKVVATPKVGDRGVTCMFVGYNTDSGDDVYRMWNPNTKRLHRTRDIRWLGRNYFSNNLIEEARKEDSTTSAHEIDDTEDKDDEDDKDGKSDLDSVEDAEDAISDEDEDDDDGEGDDEWNKVPNRSTRSGRAVRSPDRLIESAAPVVGFTRQEAVGKMELSNVEANYYAALMNLSCAETDNVELEELDAIHLQEYACVGAGIGGGFQNTKELHVMKFKEAMASEDKVEWEGAVDKEHDNMETYGVWTPVKLADLPAGTKILSSTWAMKKKANGTHRARVVARGFEQVEGVHYDGASIAAPVTNDMSIRIIMVLALMAGWASKIVDVKGAFLRGEFEDGAEPVYLKVPEGFEKFYPKNVVLMLLRTIYGLCEAAMAFWKEMLKAFRSMNFERSTADPCLYYKWTTAGFLIVWLSWIDDCACFGKHDDVEESRTEMNQLFECDDIGEIDEYVGCKIDKSESGTRFTQPVMLQSFEDEFNLENVRETVTPADPGSTLPKVDEDTDVDARLQTYYRSGVGKLLHMMRWSRPDVYNAVRDLSRHMKACTGIHVKAMHRVMKYCVSTPKRGWRLRPTRSWNGKKGFLFKIRGKSDSDYATCPDTRKSVSGYAVYLEDAPITLKSLMQRIIALSVTEAETIAGVACVQEMIYAMKILLSMGLLVELPMILEMDNKGAVDMANNWSVGGRTKHMDVRYLWLRELKEQGIIRVIWTSGESNDADLFTKNLPGPVFHKHAVKFVGENADD